MTHPTTRGRIGLYEKMLASSNEPRWYLAMHRSQCVALCPSEGFPGDRENWVQGHMITQGREERDAYGQKFMRYWCNTRQVAEELADESLARFSAIAERVACSHTNQAA